MSFRFQTTQQNSKAHSYFQDPARWVPPTSWVIWVPVGSPSHLSNGYVLPAHQWHPSLHFFYRVHTCISPLPRGRLPLFLTQRATTHRKAFMNGIYRSALWPSGPSLDLVSISPEQAETNKGAVEVRGLHSVASWRTATSPFPCGIID